MEEHANILATNFMKRAKTVCRLKRKLNFKTCVPDLVPQFYIAYATGHTLFETSINCQMSNVTW